MRYWLYSEGNILGPYSPAELLSVPAFAQTSLVCPETATGNDPGDWRSADQVAEIGDSLSVGVGGIVPSGAGSLAGTYELETGFSSAVPSHYDAGTDQPHGYESLLNTIDNILGAYKEAETPSAQPKDAEPDSSLMDRFDIRLSKIQEELEAARWEKNLLLERLRSRDREEQKNKERIMELEEKLRNASEKTELQDKEMAQFRHLSELHETSDAAKKISEIKKESREDQRRTAESRAADEKRLREIKPELLRAEAPEPRPKERAEAPQAAAPEEIKEIKPQPVQGAAPEARPAPGPQAKPETFAPAARDMGKLPESRPLKSMRPSQAVGLERTLGADTAGEADEKGVTSRKLTSLGHSQLQSFSADDFKDKKAPAEKPGAGAEPLQPLPQQASGIVYDFTVVTKAAHDSEKFQFQIGSKSEPAPAPAAAPAPAQDLQRTMPSSMQPPAQQAAPDQQQAVPPQSGRPAFQQGAAAAGAPGFMQTQPSWMGGTVSAPGPKIAKAPAADAKPAAGPAVAAKAGSLPDKTERIPVPTQKKTEEVKAQPEAKKKRGKMAFLVTLAVFGAIAAGGLGYLFFGEGGLDSFSMLSFGKKPKDAAAAAQSGFGDDKAVLPPDSPDSAAKPSQSPGPAPETPASPKPAPEPSANENTKKAMEIVKNYKLSGGRGTISSWFANSFLSSSASGLNEEWSATILHGDIFVVQYRLLKPKQDPLIYQFEVDVAKAVIVRGINNNAIELLDFSSKATAMADKPAKPKKAPKPKARTLAQLPLPEDPGRQVSSDEPSGFETPAPDENEKVKYIRAQESDEELF